MSHDSAGWAARHVVEQPHGILRQSSDPYRELETDIETSQSESLSRDSSSRSVGRVARAQRTVLGDNSGKMHVGGTRPHQETLRRLYEPPSSFWWETYDMNRMRVFLS